MNISLLASTAFTLSIITSGMAMAQSSTSAPLSTQDALFVKKAAAGGEAEIMMGQLAEKRSLNAKTRNFAQIMIADHSKANDQLKQITTPMGVTPDDSSSAMQTVIYHKLEAIPVGRFDSMYARVNIQGHETMAKLFQTEIGSGESAPLKAYAEQTLPIVEAHLAMAKKLVATGNSHMPKLEMKAGDTNTSADQLNAKELLSISHS